MVHEYVQRHTCTHTHVHIHAHIPEYMHSLETQEKQENLQRRVNKPRGKEQFWVWIAISPMGAWDQGPGTALKISLKSCWNNWELCYGLGVPLGKSLCSSLNPQSTVLGGGANRRDQVKRSQASWTTGFFGSKFYPTILSSALLPYNTTGQRFSPGAGTGDLEFPILQNGRQ